jgi:DNA segregation ATPase FtsK/SpoIIIE-like protein
VRYVYLVRAGANKYKIGVSRNVEKRIAALQTSNIHLVELVCAKRTVADSEYEKKLHKKVREFSGTGGKEWFHLSPEQAIEIAIEISDAPEVDVAENIIQDLKREVSKIIEAYEFRLAEETKQLEFKKLQFEEMRSGSSLEPPVKKTTQPIDIMALRKEADEEDYLVAKEIVLKNQHASTSFLQRRMRIGYGKAARHIERMEEEGLIGPLDGIRRQVL